MLVATFLIVKMENDGSTTNIVNTQPDVVLEAAEDRVAVPENIMKIWPWKLYVLQNMIMYI